MLHVKKTWKERIGEIKTDIHALYLAARDPRVPAGPKVLIVLITAYALSPIDLIPDFIPVLGYLDDLLLLPLGIALAVKMIGPQLMAEFREKARSAPAPVRNRIAAAVIVGFWIFVIAYIVMKLVF